MILIQTFSQTLIIALLYAAFMDTSAMMNQEIVKEALFKHGQAGGISMDDLKKELKDIPEDAIESVVENLMFGGQLEETEDGKLLMVSYF